MQNPQACRWQRGEENETRCQIVAEHSGEPIFTIDHMPHFMMLAVGNGREAVALRNQFLDGIVGQHNASLASTPVQA
jgi:hypothetical protein